MHFNGSESLSSLIHVSRYHSLQIGSQFTRKIREKMESVDASIGIGKNRQVAPVGTTEKEESRECENYVLSRRVRAVHTAHARPK